MITINPGSAWWRVWLPRPPAPPPPRWWSSHGSAAGSCSGRPGCPHHRDWRGREGLEIKIMFSNQQARFKDSGVTLFFVVYRFIVRNCYLGSPKEDSMSKEEIRQQPGRGRRTHGEDGDAAAPALGLAGLPPCLLLAPPCGLRRNRTLEKGTIEFTLK